MQEGADQGHIAHLRLAGLRHDLGRYHSAFQEYQRRPADPDAHIEGRPRRVDHSTPGALFAVEQGVSPCRPAGTAGHARGLRPFPERKGVEAESTPVNRIRAEVLARCREMAVEPPGHFSLTVPTGEGKTRASHGFALDHALTHGNSSIVCVISYTSNIEQPPDLFCEVFAGLEGAVIERHSNAEADPRQREQRHPPRLRELGRATDRHHRQPVPGVPLRRPHLPLPQAAKPCR